MEIAINVNIGVTPELRELLINLAVAASNRASVANNSSFAFKLPDATGEAKPEKPARTTKAKPETLKANPEPQPEPEPEPVTDTEEGKPTRAYTPEEVRAKAIAVTQGVPERQKLFKALLTEVDATKLTEIKPEHYPLVMQRLEEMEKPKKPEKPGEMEA